MTEQVNRPDHYQTAAGYQAADVLDAYALGPHLWNAGKYLLRAGKKDPKHEATDLKKAQWYVERAIANAGLCCAAGQRNENGLTIDKVVADFGLNGSRESALRSLLKFGAQPRVNHLHACRKALAVAIAEVEHADA